MHVYNYSKENLEKRVPITKEEILQIERETKIGDVVCKRKHINPFSIENSETRLYKCTVLQKYNHGVLVKRKIRKDLYVKDFITYIDLIIEERKNEKM